MLGGLITSDKIYDVIIRTQQEFDALIASPTWLDAKSVLFVGDGGTLIFLKDDGKGICVPSTVKRISAINLAIINVMNFDPSNIAAFYYDNLPASNDTYIEHIKLVVHGVTGGTVTGFHHCTIMRGCTCNVLAYGEEASAFNACSNIESCIGIVTGTGKQYGFINCSRINTSTALVNLSKDLTNCCFYGCAGIESGDAGTGDIGFRGCTHLSNCVSNYNRIGFSFSSLIANCISNVRADEAIDPNGIIIGFDNCTHLSNCESVANDAEGRTKVPATAFNSCGLLVNCSGSGISKANEGYGFYNCNCLNSCRPSGNATSTTGLLGGANHLVDASTVSDVK